MSEPHLEVILNSSGGEVECFLDPDNEVFFGPVTEREREIRRPLPRKTLHPCEITEISKRGMTFREWEDFKDQVHKNEMNDEAIKEVYGLNSSITEDSFTSCITVDDDEPQKAAIVKVENQDSSIEQESPRQSPQELSGVESLNDTWEIQERMLALAEKLERGEEIPELGITRHPSGMIEYTEIADVTADNKSGVLHSKPKSAKVVKCEPSEEVFKRELLEEVCPKKENVDGEDVSEFLKSPILTSVYDQRKTPSVENLAKEMDCLFLAQTLLETPVKPSTPKTFGRLTPSSIKNPRSSPRIVSDTPMKTPNGLGIKHRSTPIQKQTPLKKPITLKASSSKNVLPTASPVGMYIRSLPEPILIENVRSAQKKKQINSSPMTKPPSVAIKNTDGRWSIARTPRTSSTATSSKENFLSPSDFVPVLPTVLHEAAGTLIDEGKITPSTSTPGTRGKIGKLLERGITPTVMKHQGRIQIAKDTASSAKVIHSPVSAKSAQKSSSLMEVSVLEAVRVTKSYTPLKTPNRK